VGAVCRWVLDSLCFGAGAERPVQPLRIYNLHRGNCGEYADMTSAAARAALIPTTNVIAYANDHTWNQFYDGAWHQFEPVNGMVNDFDTYDRDGDVPGGWWWLLGTRVPRGDGSAESYSGLTATLVAQVSDAAGRPGQPSLHLHRHMGTHPTGAKPRR
jgi:transglutaminase-like putative cysteine protease